MGRRSDHSREELEKLILEEGHRHMAEAGFARFSAREVAKRIGTVATLKKFRAALGVPLDAQQP